MQAEESIEIKHIFARNIDAGPHGVILRLRMRHHNVQSVSRAALEDDDQAFVARARLRHAPCGTSKKARHRRRTDDGQRAVAQKDATSKCHNFPWRRSLLRLAQSQKRRSKLRLYVGFIFSGTPANPAATPRSY